MARPKTVYHGGARPNWVLSLVLTVLMLVVLTGIWLFYDLQQHLVYDKEGVRRVSPGMDLRSMSDGGGGYASRQLPLIDVEIVVDKTDYSDADGTDGEGLSPLHGHFIRKEHITGSVLNSFTYGLGSYNALVLELMDSSGELAWHSSVPLAESYGVNGSFELADYISLLKEKDVWLVAQLSALCDGSMAVRNPPSALRNADGSGIYLNDGQGWLDPYSDVTRGYLTALMTELAEMGFDEILMTGFYLPQDGTYCFGGEMTETPDGASAVSSLALYLRSQADALGLRLSGMAERSTLANAEGESVSQDLAVFFKAFDRVAYTADYAPPEALRLLQEKRGDKGSGEARVVAVASGRVPNLDSYIVK